MLTSAAEIIKEVEKWASQHGSGGFSDPDYVTVGNFGDYSIPNVPGIQQVREEIEEFVDLLLSRGMTGSILEVGLGYYGSTHFLWRLFFDKIITVEKFHERVREFGSNTRKYHGKWVLDDGRSSFLIGDSCSTATAGKAYRLLAGKPVDVLFIDGDHSYDGILADWLLYHPLVRKGGLVAFHDALLTGPELGVADFLERLAKGEIDGKPREITTIAHSRETGIAYYVQP